MNIRETNAADLPIVKTDLTAVVQDIRHAMSDIMKRARHGNNADTNCGYLTEYAIETLRALLKKDKKLIMKVDYQ